MTAAAGVLPLPRVQSLPTITFGNHTPMKKTATLLLLLSLAVNANAKEKMLPLTESAASALTGKSLVVTRHERPAFTAMTAGKAMFGLLGGGAMVVAGNKIIDENQVADPAEILERELVPALSKRYGLVVKPASTPIITEKKAAKIAATQTDTDYILDIRSGGWMFAYEATNWDKYWALYSVQIQLIDAKSGALVSNMGCNASNQKDPNAPTREAMLANQAALLKDITQGFGWTCAQLLAKEQFHLTESEVNATPAQYVDVLAKYAAAQTVPPANAAVVSTAEVAPASAEDQTDVAAPAAGETSSAEAAPAEPVAPAATESPVSTGQ